MKITAELLASLDNCEKLKGGKRPVFRLRSRGYAFLFVKDTAGGWTFGLVTSEKATRPEVQHPIDSLEEAFGCIAEDLHAAGRDSLRADLKALVNGEG